MKYFDAHCHVQFPVYDEDREIVLASMRNADIGALVVGCDLESSKKAVELVEERENLWAAVGLHPNHETDECFEMDDYRPLAALPKTIAIGECGLDYFRPAEVNDEVKSNQKDLFTDHIELALETEKPLIIHARPSKGTMDAYEDALTILESYTKTNGDKLRGDFHFFVGDIAIARRIFELDFTISYTAVLTFSRDYDEVVRFAPLSHLLSETDSPYVAPKSRRGQRNDPLAVMEVVESVAQIRSQDIEEVRAKMLENAQRFFLAR